MTSSNILLLLGRCSDVVSRYQISWLLASKQGSYGGGGIPDSEKPGLFRVKETHKKKANALFKGDGNL